MIIKGEGNLIKISTKKINQKMLNSSLLQKFVSWKSKIKKYWRNSPKRNKKRLILQLAKLTLISLIILSLSIFSQLVVVFQSNYWISHAYGSGDVKTIFKPLWKVKILAHWKYYYLIFREERHLAHFFLQFPLLLKFSRIIYIAEYLLPGVLILILFRILSQEGAQGGIRYWKRLVKIFLTSGILSTIIIFLLPIAYPPEIYLKTKVITKMAADHYSHNLNHLSPLGCIPSRHILYPTCGYFTFKNKRIWKYFFSTFIGLTSISIIGLSIHYMIDIFSAIAVVFVANKINILFLFRFWKKILS